MNKTKFKYKLHGASASVLAGVCVFFAAELLLNQKLVSGGVRDGVRLCFEVIIPSLFPFMVLSGFVALSRASLAVNAALTPVTALLRLPKAAAAPLLAGFTGSYPVGARTLASMVREHRITPEDASRMLCFCVNAGPPFLLCAVGAGMLGSRNLGLMLLAAQVGSALIIGLFMGFFARKTPRDNTAPPSTSFRPYTVCLVGAVNDACAGMLSICAFVVLFSAVSAVFTAGGGASVLAGVIARILPFADIRLINGVITGVLEVTTGCKALAECGYMGVMCIAGLISFSGISVIFQVLAAIHGSGIKAGGFVLSRFAHSALTYGIFALLMRIFPQTVTAALSLNTPVKASSTGGGASVFLLLMCAVFLLNVGTGFTPKQTNR